MSFGNNNVFKPREEEPQAPSFNLEAFNKIVSDYQVEEPTPTFSLEGHQVLEGLSPIAKEFLDSNIKYGDLSTYKAALKFIFDKDKESDLYSYFAKYMTPHDMNVVSMEHQIRKVKPQVEETWKWFCDNLHTKITMRTDSYTVPVTIRKENYFMHVNTEDFMRTYVDTNEEPKFEKIPISFTKFATVFLMLVKSTKKERAKNVICDAVEKTETSKSVRKFTITLSSVAQKLVESFGNEKLTFTSYQKLLVTAAKFLGVKGYAPGEGISFRDDKNSSVEGLMATFLDSDVYIASTFGPKSCKVVALMSVLYQYYAKFGPGGFATQVARSSRDGTIMDDYAIKDSVHVYFDTVTKKYSKAQHVTMKHEDLGNWVNNLPKSITVVWYFGFGLEGETFGPNHGVSAFTSVLDPRFTVKYYNDTNGKCTLNVRDGARTIKHEVDVEKFDINTLDPKDVPKDVVVVSDVMLKVPPTACKYQRTTHLVAILAFKFSQYKKPFIAKVCMNVLPANVKPLVTARSHNDEGFISSLQFEGMKTFTPYQYPEVYHTCRPNTYLIDENIANKLFFNRLSCSNVVKYGTYGFIRKSKKNTSEQDVTSLQLYTTKKTLIDIDEAKLISLEAAIDAKEEKIIYSSHTVDLHNVKNSEILISCFGERVAYLGRYNVALGFAPIEVDPKLVNPIPEIEEIDDGEKEKAGKEEKKEENA
jgi:hypothetical protein